MLAVDDLNSVTGSQKEDIVILAALTKVGGTRSLAFRCLERSDAGDASHAQKWMGYETRIHEGKLWACDVSRLKEFDNRLSECNLNIWKSFPS